MRASLPVLAVALVLAGCVAPGADVAPQAVADLPLVGEVVRSLVVDDTRWSGEPSILAMADGTLLITGAGGMTRYVEDPSDAPGEFGQSYIWRSEDGGATWAFVDLGLPQPVNAVLPYRNAILGVEGDLAEDEAGNAYFVDLTMLAANGLAASDDSGKTWTADQNPLVGLPATDRPWVSAMGDGHVYVKYLQMRGEHRVARSTDGGRTFLEDVGIPACGQGAPVVDLAAKEVLIPCAVGEDLSFLRAGEGPMEWERVDVLTAGGDPSNVFVSMAVAQTGHYVFAWSERSDEGATLHVAASADRGETWSAPLALSTPGRTAVFPWVDANADGVVAVVWYEADVGGQPDELDGAWLPMHARLLFADGALSAPQVSALAAEPVHEGSICTSGLGCVLDGRAKDRRLLDFFEVDVDAAGASHVTWTSTTGEAPRIWYGQVAP